MQMQSSAFGQYQEIPERYSGEGEDCSPPLTWSGAPTKTKTYALIVDDPDAPAGTFVHWLVFNIPAIAHDLPEGMQHRGDMSDGTLQGSNDFDRVGYGGPCPPAGRPHRYRFNLYALDDRLDLSPGASRTELEQAMRHHVLDYCQLIGRYARHHH
jgi:Raf kinase inhibitor-like YbhB/YbcL family protein